MTLGSGNPSRLIHLKYADCRCLGKQADEANGRALICGVFLAGCT